MSWVLCVGECPGFKWDLGRLQSGQRSLSWGAPDQHVALHLSGFLLELLKIWAGAFGLHGRNGVWGSI